MLVLSRKVGERILIGDDIAITVVRLSGGGVRLGIEAPRNIPVVRDELKQQAEAAAAANEVIETHVTDFFDAATKRPSA